MAELVFTILGCGSSGGVPRLGGHWGACDPTNPKNRRQRCSLLVERHGTDGITRVLIDTSPDMRNQLLSENIGELDAVVYTHAHADHVHGLDDLRMIVFNMRQRLPVWADAPTTADLTKRFGYAFVQPKGSNYPPICELNLISDKSFTISGAGGDIPFQPFKAKHGSIDALGFRIKDVGYLPDVEQLYDDSWDHLTGLHTWILDCLRNDPHPTHINKETALAWIAQTKTQNGVLTNLHNDLDYAALQAETPDHIQPAYDGLKIRVID